VEVKIKEIFSRQYKRMENELKDVNVPPVVLTVLSKYWSYCEKDILRTQGDRDGREEIRNR
jgi:hypothetical protein